MVSGQLLAVLAVVGIGAFIEARPSSPSLHVSFENYVDMLHTINSSPMLRREWRRHVSLSREAQFGGINSLSSLTCASGQRSSARPSSVHRLTPGDIDVIAAMGDSLTAGNGVLAWTILGCLTEYRGRSWSIGGDKSYTEGVTTLPNILRQFNPNLRGFSTGSGDTNSNGAKLNVAVAGNIAQDMPAQAINLVNKLKADPNIDFVNDWKMVTLFIGGNNLCAFCNDLEAHSAETMISNVAQALDTLRDNVPRLYVNLVEIFDITPVAQLGGGFICGLVHSSVCKCGHGANADTVALSQLSGEYQRAIADLVASGRYDGREDFTVVDQPFFRETVPPSEENSSSPDLSYFAPDCFHFSSKGQNLAGKALWNSLISPVSSKSTDWGLSQPVKCPTTQFIPTKYNS